MNDDDLRHEAKKAWDAAYDAWSEQSGSGPEQIPTFRAGFMAGLEYAQSDEGENLWTLDDFDLTEIIMDPLNFVTFTSTTLDAGPSNQTT